MAIGIDNTKPDSVDLEILTLVNNEGEGFDIRDLMIECAINESITGSLKESTNKSSKLLPN